MKNHICANPNCKNPISGKAKTCSANCRKSISRARILEEIDCPTCALPFTPTREGQRFCCDRCRYKQHDDRKTISDKADNALAYDTASRLAEMYYTLPTDAERLDLLDSILLSAANGSARIYRALTAPGLVKPDHEKKGLFFRKAPETYLTIAQIMQNYCMAMFGMPTAAALRNRPAPICTSFNVRHLDTRGAYRASVEPALPLSDAEIEARMQDRAPWVVDYLKQIHARRPATSREAHTTPLSHANSNTVPVATQTASITKETDAMPAFTDIVEAEREIALRLGQYRFSVWDDEAKAYKTNRKPMTGHDLMQVAELDRLQALSVILHNRDVEGWNLAETSKPEAAPAAPDDVVAAIRQTFASGTGTVVTASVVVSLVEDHRKGETFATVHFLHDADKADLATIRDAIASGVPQGCAVFMAEGGRHYKITSAMAA